MVFLGALIAPGLTVGLVRHAATRRENLAASPMRAAVLQLVTNEPGIMFSELRGRLNCSPGTLQHHVNLLERERFLVSVQSGRRRRLFLAGMSPEARHGVDLLRSGRTWQLIQSVLENPGIIQKEITRGMSISRKVLRCYLDRLAEQGLVREVAMGRFRSYYPSDQLFQLIERMHLPQEAAPQAPPSDVPALEPADPAPAVPRAPASPLGPLRP